MFSFKTLISPEGFKTLLQEVVRLHARFPFTLLCSLLATYLAVYMIGHENLINKDPQYYVRPLLTLIIGVPLVFSAEIFGERQPKSKWLAILLALFILAIHYFTNDFGKDNNHPNLSFFIKTAVMLVVGHLCVSFVPYLRWESAQAFWQYNKTLFIAILTAFVYSVTLAGGLVLALLAIKNLFDLKPQGYLFAQVFVFINGYINTLLFLSNLKTLPQIDSDTNYPKELKYFTQYVLLPLVGVYVLILLAYEAKIIAIQSLPRGWVSNLVLASGVFGILAFLLVYPLKNSYAWVSRFTRGYYLVLLPLVGLMFVAIYTRISSYGVTEPRYFVAILAIWLLGMAVYFGILNKTNIKIIPISLAAVLLMSIFGPLSSFDVSLRNQANRLKEALVQNNLLNKDGTIIPITTQKLSVADSRKISAGFDYLSNREVETLKSFFKKVDYDTIAQADRWHKMALIKQFTNISGEVEETPANGYTHVYAKDELVKLDKADYTVRVESEEGNRAYQIDGHSFLVVYDDKKAPKITINKEVFNFDLQPFTKINETEITVSRLTAQSENANWKLVLVLNNIDFESDKKIYDYNGRLYISKK